MMNAPDLNQLLRHWRDIEPPGNFEANVWRRIRRASAEQPVRVNLTNWLRDLVWQPAFAVAIAMAVVIGVTGGMRSASTPTTTTATEVGFLSPGTLAGSYARLAAGVSR